MDRHSGFASLLLLSFLLAPAVSIAAEPPPGTLTTFNNVGMFDGGTGLLNSCVALQNAAGEVEKDASGQARLLALTLRLASPDLIFRVDSAAPFDSSTGKSCSGSFRAGVYRDQVLIANADPTLDGRVLSLMFDHVPGTEADLRLRNDAASLAVLRNITGNSTQIGTSLGSFQVSSLRDFSNGLRPASVTMTLPQCADPQGDANLVILERDGTAFATGTPGAEYTWNVSALAAGEHLLRVYCSDEAAVRQLYQNAGLEVEPARFGISAYATGNFRVRLGAQTAAPSPSPSPAPSGSVFAFQFDAATSSEDRQLIEDAVQFASSFYQSTLGRTVQQSTTIATSRTATGCTSGGASAFTGARNMTICVANQGWTVHGPVTRRKIIIHEVFHLLQFEQRWIGGPQPAGLHWMIEGAAEYLGWLGIANQGTVSISTARGCMLKEVTDFAASQPPGLPDLNLLESAQSFSRPGPVYPLAMLGVQHLMSTSSADALLTYGAAIAAGNTAESAFQNAFGASLPAFYQQFPAWKALPVPATYECRL
jgi:hypothetical protein